jgi:hypothetical protein
VGVDIFHDGRAVAFPCLGKHRSSRPKP